MDKREITLFYDGAWYTFRWLKTMLWASDYFRKYGYEVSFLNEDEYVHSYDKTKIFESSVLNNEFDIVFLAYHDAHVGLCSLAKDKFAYLMSVLRKKSNVVVWLDTSDSTGNIYKEAFGYVDKYLKKQIYSDLNVYKQRHWGHRLYTNYYYVNRKLSGDFADEYDEILTDDEIKKIGISWNVGLGDLFGDRNTSYQNPMSMSLIKPSAANGKRNIDVQFRGTYDYSICGYQRNQSLEILSLMKEVKKNDMLSKIDFESYLQEIATSKIVISPYGWGEICSRDFEAFIGGALLLKPDMSHMITYPNWYVANETYVPTKWDFSDFKEKILEMIDSDERRIQIAENAQAIFLHHRNTNEGKDEFARHIISQIKGL